jgi:iron complex outermembrane receptor protein
LGLELSDYAALHASLTWLRSENALDQRLPFRPEYVSYVRPEAHLSFDQRVVSRAGLFAELSDRSFAYVDNANLAYVGGCLQVGLGAFLELLQRRLRLSANIADANDARCTDLIGYPLPGRSFFLSLSYKEMADET